MTSAKRSFRFTRFLLLLAIVITSLMLMIAWLTTRPNIAFRERVTPASEALASDIELPARLERHVRTIVTQFAPRDHEHLAQLEGASRYIEGELSKHATTRFQNFNANGKSYRNVIAQIGPDTQEIIVIGAHYDSYGALPAADDNASGVAGLIELAQVLSKLPLRQRVELVAYTLEEPPYFRTEFMGSAIHAKSLKAAGKRVSLMLSLECIGYFSDAPGSQDFPISAMGLAYPTTGNFIALVGHYREGALSRRVRETMRAATPLPVHSINAPAFVAGIDFSDHLNYWNEGFVGMMVTDTAFMRNKNYHTAGDTPETLDYRRMGEVVRAVAAVVRDVNAGVVVESR
jgi:Zn-dependent M28 family amino/carboxypeptidase